MSQPCLLNSILFIWTGRPGHKMPSRFLTRGIHLYHLVGVLHIMLNQCCNELYSALINSPINLSPIRILQGCCRVHWVTPALCLTFILFFALSAFIHNASTFDSRFHPSPSPTLPYLSVFLHPSSVNLLPLIFVSPPPLLLFLPVISPFHSQSWCWFLTQNIPFYLQMLINPVISSSRLYCGFRF